MKKVTLRKTNVDSVKFLLRGQPHSASAVEVEIDEKGVVMSDEDAEIIKSRLGSQVTVSEIDGKEAAKLAKKAAEEVSAGDNESNDGNVVPQVSATVKKLAEEAGIDLTSVVGTGANGNIIKADVEAAIEAKEEAEGGGE